MNSTVRAPDFRARWLAESARFQETEHGPVPDADAVRFARQAGGDLEQRIIARAAQLPGAERLASEQPRFLQRLGATRLVLLLIAALLGFGLSLTITGDPATPINVFWALAAYFIPQLLSITLWLVGMTKASGSKGGVIGRAWSRSTLRWLPRGVASQVARAFYGLHQQGRLLRWWLGATMHGAWSLAFVGMLLGLLVALSLRSYGFVLETTILPEGAFRQLVAALGWLPAQLGVAAPDEQAIRTALRGDAWDQSVRQAWAFWFVGLLLVYGLAPRLLLWGFCAIRLARGRRALRLDLSQPGYARLREALLPASDVPTVVDPSPRMAAGSAAVRNPRARGAPVAVALEPAGDPWPWPLPAGVRDAGPVDSRAQREAVLESLRQAPPRRLLVACNAALSPDRGSLRLIESLAANAADAAAWLARSALDRERAAAWRQALAMSGIEGQQVFEDYEEARAWLSSR